MGMLSNIKTSVAISHHSSVFKHKEMDSDLLPLEENETTNSLLPSYAINSTPQDTLAVTNPMMVMLEAQSSKRYYDWEFNPASEMVWHASVGEAPGAYFALGRLSLVGTTLILQGCDTGILKVSLVDENDNVGNANVEILEQSLSVNYGSISLVCTSEEFVKVLGKLCMVSIFEHNSIYKALTGAIISTYGMTMSDMHVILHSSFSFKDWCEIYLEDEGWVKVWCHIDKVNKKSSSDIRNGNCQIKFYRNDKSKSSKNLICFIPDCAYVQDIFFYKDCKRRHHHTSKSTSTITRFLNSVNTIKIIGNVSFPSEGYTNKSRSNSMSSMSFFSKNESRTRSSSSSSVNTATSPLQSPKKNPSRSPTLKMFSPTRKHQRTLSQVSMDSVYSTYKDLENCTISSKGLNVRPVSHNGVNHLESLIRFIIPMMDCMNMYGRPNRFKTDRKDLGSLMFGLPKLPCIDYFATEEIQYLLQNEANVEATNSTDGSAVAMHWLTNYMRKSMTENSMRSEGLTFKTLSDIQTKNEEYNIFSETKDGSFTSNSSPIV